MRLTRFTDNALRCLLYLAEQPERVATVHEIAKETGMSPDHLLKVVKRLGHLGYVQTIRGRRGGVRLGMAPSSIRVGDVVRATEDNMAIVPCFGATGDECPMGPACGLAACMHEALGAFFAVLGRYTVADLGGRPWKDVAA